MSVKLAVEAKLFGQQRRGPAAVGVADRSVDEPAPGAQSRARRLRGGGERPTRHLPWPLVTAWPASRALVPTGVPRPVGRSGVTRLGNGERWRPTRGSR